MKKILVIGGGKWQVPIVKKCKELGYIVINSNLYENSEGFEYSDYSYVCDVLDIQKNLQIAKEHNVDVVLTDQSDIAVKTVAFINEKLGLSGVGVDIAELFTNKLRMRNEICIEGLEHPLYTSCTSIEEVYAFFEKIKRPIVLKPLSNQSSRGVSLVKSINDIPSAYKNTIKFVSKEPFLVEEYISGFELTLEGFKYKNGNHHTFAISKKEHYKDSFSVAKALVYTNEINGIDFKRIESINNQIFKNLNFGITHVEYKWHNNKLYLVEAAIRGGGTKISSHIVPEVSGYDINELLIRTALNEDVFYIKNNYSRKCALLKFLDLPSGKVKNIFVENEIINDMPSVIDFELEFDVNDEIDKPCDDRSRLGYMIVSKSTFPDLIKEVSLVESLINIEVI